MNRDARRPGATAYPVTPCSPSVGVLIIILKTFKQVFIKVTIIIDKYGYRYIII